MMNDLMLREILHLRSQKVILSIKKDKKEKKELIHQMLFRFISPA